MEFSHFSRGIVGENSGQIQGIFLEEPQKERLNMGNLTVILEGFRKFTQEMPWDFLKEVLKGTPKSVNECPEEF